MGERSGFGYFLLGLGVGVAAGVLWAPKAGEEMRQMLVDKAAEGADFIKDRAQEGTEYVRNRADDVRQSAADLYDKGVTTVVRQKETINAAVEAGKQAYREAVTDGKPGTAQSSISGTAESI